MEEAASRLEREHVHSVYDKIAPYFNDSRYKAWPKVRQFLLDLQPGSIVADVGCGNGKYLHINKEVFKLGCDVCRPLVDAAGSQGHEVQMCDGLQLPYRDGCFDAVLSIAVIHHLSTKERRIRAIKEMARTLRVGGRLMIYVWAMEQKRRRFEKQDIFVPWNPNPHSLSDGGGVKPRRRAAAQSTSEATDRSDKHRKVRSTSSVADEQEEGLADAAPQRRTQRHWFFSRSLDSVFDFGSLAISRPVSSRDGSALPSPAGEADKGKRSRGHGLIKQVSSFFLPPSVIGSEEDVFDAAVGEEEEEEEEHKGDKSPGTGALFSPDSGFGSVPLPDLIPLGNEHLKQPRDARSTKSRRGSEELAEEPAEGSSSCLRYYHVFREGELAELIQSHVAELRVSHAYFDHANWCVVAEKVQPWKI